MTDLQVLLTEITGGGGFLAFLSWLSIKFLYPAYKTRQKNKTDENKLKIKMGATTATEIVDMLKAQIEELKEHQKNEDVTHEKEKEKLQKEIIKLQISLATLKERYKENALHSRGCKKDEKSD